MSDKYLSPMEAAQIESASQDRTDRHLSDQQIRRAGYTIAHRPPGASPIWERAGVKYPQPEVLRKIALAKAEAARNAKGA